MSDPGVLFARFLRQRQEFGESELVFEASRRELLRSIDARGTHSPSVQVAGPITTRPPLSREATPASAPVVPPAPPTIATSTRINRPLVALGEAAATCTACALAETRTNVVFGDGDPHARLVVVGEAPGADEDRSGRPFVGRAGQLLNTLLLSVGMPRESVYICNVLKCRPPANRNPLPEEVQACSGFLRGQLGAIRPRVILAVGTFPAQTLLRTTETIGRLRGSVHDFEGTPLVPTYHPAALLRNPSWIRPVWEDLQRLRRLLDD